MTEKLKQTIQEEVAKLPKEHQDAINAFAWTAVAEDIGKKHLLTDDEVNNFQVETLIVLVGLTDLESYVRNIENNIGMSKEEAEEMTKEVLEKIFMPIINKMPESITSKWENPPEEAGAGEHTETFIKMASGLTSSTAEKIRNEIKSSEEGSQSAGQKDFLKDLSGVIAQSVKKN